MAAASSGNTDIVRTLLAAVRADKELTMDNIRAWAVNENIKKTILDLRVEEDRKEPRRVYVNVKDVYGWTALTYAAVGGHTDTVKALIDAIADVNPQRSPTVASLPACWAGKLLANAQDHFGFTALMWATLNGHADTVKALTCVGADVNMQDKCGKTALMLASEKGHADVVKVLLDAGADVNAQDDNGNTALSLAEQNGHAGIADMLRNAGAR